MTPHISLLVCTLNRTSELSQLLASLAVQTFGDFEVILVDQNDDDRLVAIVAPFCERLSIHHIRSNRGLSLGRNAALTRARGSIVAFPDDDCTYSPQLLAEVVDAFERWPDIGGVCGRHVDDAGQDVVARFDHRGGAISPFNVWRRSSSGSIFLRSVVTESVGHFDEALGVGSETPWGSSEEIDYLCRALEAGHRLMYDPELQIRHPRPTTDNSAAGRTRAALYSRGMGYVLCKHKYPLWFSGYMIGRPAVGACLDLLRGRLDSAKVRWSVSRGRAAGYRDYGSARPSGENRASELGRQWP